MIPEGYGCQVHCPSLRLGDPTLLQSVEGPKSKLSGPAISFRALGVLQQTDEKALFLMALVGQSG